MVIVWWALNMIDVWSSAGVRLPRLLTPKLNVPLPIDEIVFRRMTREMTRDQIPEPETRSSLLAEMVRLNRILLQINDFNMRASTEELDLDTILGHVQDLSDQLDVWLRDLPDHIRDTRANMERYAAQGLGRVFAAIYLGYYHYGQMLFYRFLHEDSQSSSTRTRQYAGKCKDHARGLCDIVYASEEVPGCDVRYNMVGHVLVIASTVQIHSLLFEADEQQVALARSRLEKNYVFLIRLRSLWPTLEFCMDRLMAFHEACKNSADTTFYMDRWMVRFLVEFASPVGDRDSCAKDRSPWSLELLIHPNEVTHGS